MSHPPERYANSLAGGAVISTAIELNNSTASPVQQTPSNRQNVSCWTSGNTVQPIAATLASAPTHLTLSAGGSCHKLEKLVEARASDIDATLNGLINQKEMSAEALAIHSTVAHAVNAAGAGWRVVELRPSSKRPKERQWQHNAINDPALVQSRWKTDPDANYGVHLGASGLIVVDADGNEGHASLEAAERDLGPLPPTLTVSTPDGSHRYYRDPGSIPRRLNWRPSLDVLAGNCYAVGPGSIANGWPYRLIGCDLIDASRVAELPESWTAALRGEERAHTSNPIPPQPNGENAVSGVYGVAGVSGITGVQYILDRHPLAKRHTSFKLIHKLARHIRPLFPNEASPPAEVHDALRQWWESGQANTERSWGDTYGGFNDAWRRVDLGRGPLAQALRAAQEAGCHPEVSATFPDPADAPLRLLAALMAELDRRANGEPFFLAQEEAALLIGVNRPRAGKWFRMFPGLGWLKLIEPYCYTKGRANTYRWQLPDGFSTATGGAGSQDDA